MPNLYHKNYDFSSISRRLVFFCIAIAFFTALIVCVLFLGRDVVKQVQTNEAYANELLEIKATEVQSGILNIPKENAISFLEEYTSLPAITRAELLDPNGNRIAMSEVSETPHFPYFLDPTSLMTTPKTLHSKEIRSAGAGDVSGTLVIEIDQSYLLTDFYIRAASSFAFLFFHMFMLGLFLWICLQKYLVRPLSEFHHELSNLSLTKSHPRPKLDEMSKRKDEFGMLARTTNRVLDEAEKSIEAMNIAQERVKDLSRAASDWFWECDENGIVTNISMRFFETLGFRRETVIGDSIENFLLTNSRGTLGWDNWLQNHWYKKTAFRNVELEFRCPNGSFRMVAVSGIPYYDDSGRFMGFRGVGTDLTALSHAREEGKMLKKQLDHSENLRAIGQLTGGIAHDFNNILAIILGNLEFARSTVSDQKLQNDVDICIEAAKRGSALTERLLAFSRQQQLNPASVSAKQVVSDLAEFLNRIIGEHIELHVEVEDNISACYADVQQLETALINLVINARDAIQQKGQITIRAYETAIESNDSTEQSKSQIGNYICFEVSDNGRGIGPNDIGRVFEPFFSTKSAEKGAGLGLSMVYGFAAQSGGFADIQSELGEGTWVSLYMPRLEKSKNHIVVPSRPANPSADLRGKRILVVEDDQFVKATTVKLLEGLGCETHAVEDGEEALVAVVSQMPFDLFLFDVMLRGGENGPDLAKKLRPYCGMPPVVFMSGYSKTQIATNADLNDHFVLLRKPFTYKQLEECLRESIHRVQAEHEMNPYSKNAS